jgi:hypothetical protein
MRLRHALAAVLGCALIGASAAAAKDRHDHGRHHRGSLTAATRATMPR